jgi:hypothetical protein
MFRKQFKTYNVPQVALHQQHIAHHVLDREIKKNLLTGKMVVAQAFCLLNMLKAKTQHTQNILLLIGSDILIGPSDLLSIDSNFLLSHVSVARA